MFKRDKNFFGLTFVNVRPFSLNDILTFTSAPAAFKVKVSSYFIYELTELKPEKTAILTCINTSNIQKRKPRLGFPFFGAFDRN